VFTAALFHLTMDESLLSTEKWQSLHYMISWRIAE